MEKGFSEEFSSQSLFSAYYSARSAKRNRLRCAEFEIDFEKNLIKLQDELLNEAYLPGRYRVFFIREPKKRAIAAAPFRDRVVHHALCNALERKLFNNFIYDSYACIKDKGTHRAKLRYQAFMKKNKFALRMDVKAFFPSIDIAILIKLIEEKSLGQKLKQLCQKILINGSLVYQNQKIQSFLGFNVKKGHGLPIGNLTSQHFANLYLNALDHFIKRELKAKYYLRYMDDLVIFDREKEKLQQIQIEINSWLKDRRGLEIKEPFKIMHCKNKHGFLGSVISNEEIRVKSSSLKKTAQKIKNKEPEEIAKILRNICF